MVPALKPELLGVRTGAGAGGPSDSRATIWSWRASVAMIHVPAARAGRPNAAAARDAAATLRSRSDRELLDLFDGLWDLPQTDISLQAELPKVFSPELSRLCEVVLDKSADGPLLDAVTQQLGTPLQRARLARAVIAQERRETISHRLAAAALVDLASRSRQLLRRSVLEAVAVRVGAVRTPGGLMVAA